MSACCDVGVGVASDGDEDDRGVSRAGGEERKEERGEEEERGEGEGEE